MADNVDEIFKTVAVVNSVEEANIAAGFLQSNGIDASVESLLATEFPTEVGSLSEVRINVPAAQAEEAFRLLRESDQQFGSPTTSEAVGGDTPPRPMFEG